MMPGDNGIRTRGLCVANAALSQLSYVPINHIIAQMEKITIPSPAAISAVSFFNLDALFFLCPSVISICSPNASLWAFSFSVIPFILTESSLIVNKGYQKSR